MFKVLKYEFGKHLATTGKFYEILVLKNMINGDTRLICRYGKENQAHFGGTFTITAPFRSEADVLAKASNTKEEKNKKGYDFRVIKHTYYNLSEGSVHSGKQLMEFFSLAAGRQGDSVVLKEFLVSGGDVVSSDVPAPAPAPVRDTPKVEGWGAW